MTTSNEDLRSKVPTPKPIFHVADDLTRPLSLEDILSIADEKRFKVFVAGLPAVLRSVRDARHVPANDPVVEQLQPERWLSTLDDIVREPSERVFRLIVAELPSILHVLRAHAVVPGHAGFRWPIRWRAAGGPSTVTTHYSDGQARTTVIDD